MNETPALPPPPPLSASPAPRRSSWWKWLLGVAAVLFCLGLLVVVVLALSFNRIVRDIARNAIEKNTGLPTQIAELRVSFLRPGVLVRGFKLSNTPEFGGGTFLDLPELHIELDRPALREDKVHLNLVRLNLAELHIVVDEKGRRNTEVVQQRTNSQRKEKPKKSESPREFAGLDRLDMTLGTLRYTDLRDPSLSRTFSFGMTNALIENIKTKEELGARLFLKFIESGVPFYDLIFSGIENLPQADTDSRARRPATTSP
jgi:uncharacterized protein involved in outer membrane biogenesis